MLYFLVVYSEGKQHDTPKETDVEMVRWRGWFDRTGLAIIDWGNLPAPRGLHLPKARATPAGTILCQPTP